jgi:prephenate dehydrogenase
MEVLRSLAQYRNALDQIEQYVQQSCWDDLEALLSATQQARQSFIM